MFRVTKSGSSLIRRALQSSIVIPNRTFSAAGQRVGAPVIAIEDVFDLYYTAEPNLTPPALPADKLLAEDIKLNEVMIYLNGGQNAPNDPISTDFVNNMDQAEVLYLARDAGKRPDLVAELKKAGGSNELPQLWVKGKCVGKGKELQDLKKVRELTAVSRRPWPRQGPYNDGFPGYGKVLK